MSKLRFFLLIFIFISSFSSTAEEAPKIHKKVLDNGCTILARHVQDSPLVYVQIRVPAGLASEGEYAGSGISHFLEHLAFKGSFGRTASELNAAIRELGGEANASTGLDSTSFCVVAPAENYEKALSLLAGMVMKPDFPAEEFEKEKNVILKEQKMLEDDPSSKLSRELFSASYKDHVYRYPLIGYPELFLKLTREDLIKYHAAIFTPDRIVVGIAGGVDGGEAIKTADRIFSSYERGRNAVFLPRPERTQLKKRALEIFSDTDLGYMAMAFHTGGLFAPDFYAGEALAALLGSGEASRLHKRLVLEKRLLYGVSAVSLDTASPGLFIISGVGELSKLSRAEAAIFGVLREIRNGGVRGDELERVKNMVSADHMYSIQKTANLVSSMTESELLAGDASFREKKLKEILKVCGEDVKKFAVKNLAEDNSTVVKLLPKGISSEKKETVLAEKAFAASGKEKTFALANGMKVILKKRGDQPIASLVVFFPGGLLSETPENNGISNLVSGLLLKGTGKRSEEEIASGIEGMGGLADGVSGNSAAYFSMSFPSGHVDRALDIFEDIMENSSFPNRSVAMLKEETLAAIREEDKDIMLKGLSELRKALYTEHPYAMRPIGEKGSIGKMKRRDMLQFYRKHFGLSGAVFAVVGDVDTEKLAAGIARRFNNWKGLPRAASVQGRDVKKPKGVRNVRLEMEKEQSLFMAGFIGVDVKDKRRYALDVLNDVLRSGGGLLYDAVREEKGLSYSCGSFVFTGAEKGFFAVYASTSREDLESVKKAVFELIKNIRDGRISEEEVTSSKKRLIVNHAAALESNSAVAMAMASDELYGLGHDNYERYPENINKVTREDVLAVAREIVDPDSCVVVEVRGVEK